MVAFPMDSKEILGKIIHAQNLLCTTIYKEKLFLGRGKLWMG